jgi:replicative DNA helicase
MQEDPPDAPARPHVQQFLEEYAANREGVCPVPISTGLADVDALLGGLRPGELTVIGARPATGATTLALKVVSNTCALFGQPTAFASARLPAGLCVARMVNALARVDAELLRFGFLSRQDERQMRQACEILASFPLHLSASPLTRLDALASEWRRLRKFHDVVLFVYDGLQHLGPGTGAEVARALRSLAQELQAPVLAVGPLRRRADRRAAPVLADLWGGLDLEFQASKILLLSRGGSTEDASKRAEIVWVDVVKNETGATGRVRVDFLPQYLRIESSAVM